MICGGGCAGHSSSPQRTKVSSDQRGEQAEDIRITQSISPSLCVLGVPTSGKVAPKNCEVTPARASVWRKEWKGVEVERLNLMREESLCILGWLLVSGQL